MRRFTDPRGASWEVVVGRESWGAFFAIFIPREEAPLRQTMLAASGQEEAGRELDGMDDAALADLFERSEPKTLG